MSETEHKYGTDHTSVKVHHAPGGNSTFSLGWEEPQPARRAEPAISEEEKRRQEEEEEEERKRKEQEAARRAQEESKQNAVQTSVKVRNPPGGQSSITFG